MGLLGMQRIGIAIPGGAVVVARDADEGLRRQIGRDAGGEEGAGPGPERIGADKAADGRIERKRT